MMLGTLRCFFLNNFYHWMWCLFCNWGFSTHSLNNAAGKPHRKTPSPYLNCGKLIWHLQKAKLNKQKGSEITGVPQRSTLGTPYYFSMYTKMKKKISCCLLPWLVSGLCLDLPPLHRYMMLNMRPWSHKTSHISSFIRFRSSVGLLTFADQPGEVQRPCQLAVSRR